MGLHGAAEPAARTHLYEFHELVQVRVRRILLVTSPYESFVMSEEGHLHESLLGHFLELDVVQVPDMVQVPSAAQALEVLRTDPSFDLVVASLRLPDGDAAGLARACRAESVRAPVVALAFSGAELADPAARAGGPLERVFLWQGDVRIFLAVVLHLEDRLNAPHDVGEREVPAILVVEDDPRAYSSFLPAIYTELSRHTRRLLSEDLSLSQKLLRLRARPKVLLCCTFEEAWDLFERYEEQVLGVISDFEYPRGGRLDPDAGPELCRRVREARSDVRLVMQSSDEANAARAAELGASFLPKGSPALLQRLREVLVERFGFGDFVFRAPDGTEVARAHDLRTLAERIRTAPARTIAYHGERNHFSNWLKARTEFALARRLRPRRVDEFEGVENLRDHLLRAIEGSRQERHRAAIAAFDRERFDPDVGMWRIGTGSLGGKARGLAFAGRVLRDSGLPERHPEIDMGVPPCVVLTTEVFEEFLDWEGLRGVRLEERRDEEIERLFLGAPFPRRAGDDLRAYLQRVRRPLAVRSSGLLEDSLSQPFAGVYRTLMLPNNDPDLEVRWAQLAAGVKLVYASTFLEQARAYLGMTPYRLEEERMAVIVQRLVGRRHEDRFYPDFSGVARSRNFYPEPGHRPEDGVVAVALGMGQTVVGGEPCLRFCPRHPRRALQLSSVEDALEGSQRSFHALDLGRGTREGGLVGVLRHPLEVAERDGPLALVGSTYSADDRRIVPGIARQGVRLVSFAEVLQHGLFPLAVIVRELLEGCEAGTGVPVEIEMAGELPGPGGARGEFALLQLRPLVLGREAETVEIGAVDPTDVVCRSERSLGNARFAVRDAIVVPPERFDRLRSRQIAAEVARLDALLRKEDRGYLLIGVGRWGTSDPSLGVPVTWSQISGARVVVEAGTRVLRVEPSQGAHFFQNLSAVGAGYLTVNPDAGEGTVDWEWLAAQPAEAEGELARHLRFERPLVARLDGRTGRGVVLKPGARE